MKVEYNFFNITLVKNIGYETHAQSFDTELKEELNKFGQMGWELIFLREPYVKFNDTTRECKCCYRGLFKRIIIEEAVL